MCLGKNYSSQSGLDADSGSDTLQESEAARLRNSINVQKQGKAWKPHSGECLDGAQDPNKELW